MKQKIKIVLLTVLQLTIFIFSNSTAQNKDRWMPPPFPDINRVIIFTDPLVFYTGDSTNARLDIYIEIPISNIIFKRNLSSEIFESSIGITINIQDLNGQAIIDQGYNESTSFTNAEMHNEKEGSLYYLKTFYQNPGINILNLRVKDNNSGREFSTQDTININDKSKHDILFSDIMILSEYKTHLDKISIEYEVSNRSHKAVEFNFLHLHNKKYAALTRITVTNTAGDWR